MSKVFLVDTHKQPLDPIHPGYARKLLDWGKAAVLRRFPFTLILKQEIAEPMVVQPIRLKLDPGSRTTGLALLNDTSGDVVFAAEIIHRGQQVRDSLLSRRAIRHNRRHRRTRYRPARFLNRTRKEGWLPPSLESRLANVLTWVSRLRRCCPIQAISMELVKFDTQLLQNPEISGVEYQQGELAGYEVREYLLEKWGRKCAYCRATNNTPLQLEHIVPKARGGSNRVSNLTLACESCNLRKGTQTAAEFGYPHIQFQAKQPLKDAAAVNSTRWALYRRLGELGLPVEAGSGGLTKYNRTVRGLSKTHWLDAACVGQSTPRVLEIGGVNPLKIEGKGHGNRAMCRTDRYGFPRLHRSRQKVFFEFRTGDIGRAVIAAGSRSKKVGSYTGRIAVRASGSFDVTLGNGSKVSGLGHTYFKRLHRADGYIYSFSGLVVQSGKGEGDVCSVA